MKTRQTVYLMVVLLGAALLYSCSSTDSEPSDKGLIPVTLQMPGSYDVSSRATDNSNLVNKARISYLEQGSTLWLFATTGSTTIRQGYMVKLSTGGVKALYACKEKTLGSTTLIDTTTVSNTPMFLTSGNYTFSAISPALPVYSGNKFKILNGDTVVATNNYWNQTKATTLNLTNTKEGIVVLNPMMQAGARMAFTIAKTSKISSLDVIQSGIEIDGLGEEMASDSYFSVGDTLVAGIGNPYNRMFIKPAKIKTLDDGSKYGTIGVLPVDCRSTVVYVILNLMVNATPVQYTFALNNRVYRSGYSYDYKVTIDVKDNIVVANWQENSWSYDANPD